MSMDESLEVAIRNNDIETVNHIINSGADIAKIEYDREGDPDDLFNVGKSFLMIAVNNNNLEMLKLLVNNYDNYDDKADFYTTPLKKRNRSGYLTLKEYLNEVDYNSNVETALILAVKEEKIDIVEYLLSVGADPNIQDRSQKSALNYAIDKKNEKLIDILLEDSDTNINIGSPPPRDEPFLETYLKITKPSRLLNAQRRLTVARGTNDKNSGLGNLPFDTDLPERFVSDEDATADVIKRWIKERSGEQSTRRLQFTGRAASPTKSRSRSRSRSRSPKRGGRKRTKKRGKQTKKRKGKQTKKRKGKQTKKRGGRKRTIKRNKKKK
tara:strand:- start:726 stop:1700 length:975 start_codon:yes stop_codon:yes gene_type:complete